MSPEQDDVRKLAEKMAKRLYEDGVCEFDRPDEIALAVKQAADIIDPLLREAKTGKCHWKQDDAGNWDTDCGREFWFEVGGPKDCLMRFCCYCGKPLSDDAALAAFVKAADELRRVERVAHSQAEMECPTEGCCGALIPCGFDNPGSAVCDLCGEVVQWEDSERAKGLALRAFDAAREELEGN